MFLWRPSKKEKKKNKFNLAGTFSLIDIFSVYFTFDLPLILVFTEFVNSLADHKKQVEQLPAEKDGKQFSKKEHKRQRKTTELNVKYIIQ